MRATCSRTSSSASRRRSRGRWIAPSSSSPTSRSSRTSSTLREYKPLMQDVLEGGPLRRPRRALLPPDQPRSRARGDRRLGDARRLLVARHVPRDLPRAERRPELVLRPDDPLRLQDAPARAAPGRGPGQHGARARVADAVRRPRGDRVRGDAPGDRQVQERRAEARAEARDGRSAPSDDHGAEGQDGLPRAPCRLAEGAGERVLPRRHSPRDTGAVTSSRTPISAGCSRASRASAATSGPCSRSSSGIRASTTRATAGTSSGAA